MRTQLAGKHTSQTSGLTAWTSSLGLVVSELSHQGLSYITRTVVDRCKIDVAFFT